MLHVSEMLQVKCFMKDFVSIAINLLSDNSIGSKYQYANNNYLPSNKERLEL